MHAQMGRTNRNPCVLSDIPILQDFPHLAANFGRGGVRPPLRLRDVLKRRWHRIALLPQRLVSLQVHSSSMMAERMKRQTLYALKQELRHHNLRGVGEDVAGAAAGLRRRVRRAPPPEQDGLPRHAGGPALAQGRALSKRVNLT